MVYIYTVVEYIHHILFAVMPLVGIAQFNTDPLENFCLAEWWIDGAAIPAPRECKRPQTSLQTSAVLDEVRGHG